MTAQQFDKRTQRSADEPLVISRTEDGFRVYSPSDPTRSYIVSGSEEAPACTCPDFQYHEGDPEWACKHILAVLATVRKPAASDDGNYDAEERRAIQEEGRVNTAEAPGSASQMLLKRSVSPDGRIDSLSVEFSCPVDQATAGEIKSRASKALQLQAQIVGLFLAGNSAGNGGGNSHSNAHSNGKEHTQAAPPENGHNGMLPATLLTVGGMNTKWGRRVFLNVQVNGDTLKLFGTRKQLAESIASAGFPQMCERIDEGAALNLPCRVTTKPSDNGKYVNIEAVLPANNHSNGRGWR